MASFLSADRPGTEADEPRTTVLEAPTPAPPGGSADQAAWAFDRVSTAMLANSPKEMLDDLPYGIIGLSHEGLVAIYNATESRLAGLPTARVLGRHFFETIAQCMNNFMVAQRFADEPELDATIDFVLTLRMRPTPVKLRLLQSKGSATCYVLVQRKT